MITQKCVNRSKHRFEVVYSEEKLQKLILDLFKDENNCSWLCKLLGQKSYIKETSQSHYFCCVLNLYCATMSIKMHKNETFHNIYKVS